MKKQLLIIGLCFLGAFATIQDVNAGDHHRRDSRSSQVQRSRNSKHYVSSPKRTYTPSRNRNSSGISFSFSNGSFSISIGGSSRCIKPSYYQSHSYSQPLIIVISDGYRIYRPSYSRDAYLQKWSSCNRSWLNIKRYSNFR